METAWLNLVFAWLGILLGFISGLYLGLNFHREQWLGGYGSFQRRMYRLGHISFFGLAVVNFMFFLTTRTLAITHHISPFTDIASWAFIVGAISMPACCLLMAHFPRTHLLFAIPVLSLLLGGTLTVLTVIRSADFQSAAPAITHYVSRIAPHSIIPKFHSP